MHAPETRLSQSILSCITKTITFFATDSEGVYMQKSGRVWEMVSAGFTSSKAYRNFNKKF